MRVNIVIIAWNADEDLTRCIEYLRGAREEVLSTILLTIVDNGGNDEALKTLRALQDPTGTIQIVGMGKNIGFGAACNLGARSRLSDFVVFMNPDVFLSSSSVLKLVECIEKCDTSIVAAGPRLRTEAGEVWRSCSRLPTPAFLIFSSFGSSFNRLASTRGGFMTDWDHSHTRVVDQVIGALICMRTDSFNSIGGFDERFFVYYEEVDLCRRIADARKQVLYIADIEGVHKGGGSSKKDIRRRAFYSGRSKLLYTRKYYGWAVSLAVAFGVLVVEPLLKALAKGSSGRFSEAGNVVLGAWDTTRWVFRSCINGINANSRGEYA